MTALSLRTDGPLVRSSDSSVRHLLITVDAPTLDGPRPTRPPVDVAFVLDRSGSMDGEKIDLAREAIVRGIGMLGNDDRSSIVVYDSEVDLVAALARVPAELGRVLLEDIHARGMTNLSGGWLTACMQLAEAEAPRDVRKCLLMSDGQANQGITDRAELETHAAALRERGILTSTFGVGADFDEELMTGIARAGGGQAYFIEHAHQTAELLTSELGETLDTVLRDVKVRLRLPAGMAVELLSDFTATDAGRTQEVRLGHMSSGQSISFLLRVECPIGEPGDTLTIGARVISREQPESALTEFSWTYADNDAVEHQERDAAVDAEVATVNAARARREALRYSRVGDFSSARRAIIAAADHMVPLAAMSPAARDAMEGLRDDAPLFARAMAPTAMKQREYQARGTLSSRDTTGRARRAQPKTETSEVGRQN